MSQEIYTPIVYNNALKLVRAYVLRNCGTLEDVEDVLQEGLWVFFTRIKNNELKLEVEPEYYIFGVCRNIWMTELKRKKKFIEVYSDINESADHGFEMLEIKIKKENLLCLIEKNIKKLSERCQKVFQLRKEGLSCDEIALEMSWKNGQIAKDKFYRCKQRLLHIISEDQEYIELNIKDNQFDEKRG